jgi:hypothetical protein
MSDQITTYNYESYSRGSNMLSQQLSEMTRHAVMEESLSGKRGFFDQVGQVAMQAKTGRAVDIPVVATPHARRAVTALDYYIRDFVDEFDKLKVLNDPTNAYSQAFGAAAARQIDKIVIAAALGTAFTGEEGSTPVALPAGQQLANGGTGFTLAKLQQAVTKLKSANAVMPGDSIHVFWTARQEEEFINTSEVKSSDFNNTKVMVEGALQSFYGCNFHRVEDVSAAERILPKASTTRSCVAWVKSGMKLGVWKNSFGRVDYLPERDAWQVMAGLSAGATRMEEVKIVQIDVVES